MANPTPQEEFLLQYCNYPVQQGGYDGFGFFWDEFTKTTPDYWTRVIQLDDWLEHSYFSYNSNGFVAIQYFETGRLSNETNNEIWVAEGILRGDITTIDETHFKVEVNNINYIRNVYKEYITTNPSQVTYTDSFSILRRNNAPYYSGYSRAYSPTTSWEYTAPSRESALQELVTVFHNIEIYVDGEKWTDARAITYTWQSVASVNGKLGTVSFTRLKDELITGDTIGGLTVSDFVGFSEATNLQYLRANIGDGEEKPVIYAGNVDYISLERIDGDLYSINVYISGGSTPIYSRTWSRSGGQNAYLAFIIDNDNEVAKMAIVFANVGGGFTYNIASMSETEMHNLYFFFLAHTNYPEDTNEPEEDGEADNPWTDTQITGLTEPSCSAIDTGFTSMYEIVDGELQKLSKFLWSSSFVDNVKKFFNDPREIIVGISIMPVAPNVGSAKAITAGGITTDATGKPLTSQYRIIDLGSIDIVKSKRKRFLNYPPYTKISVHLPYCGEHSLDVNQIMGHTLSLKYIFDFLTGSCVAELSKDGNPCYFFGGNCAVQIPTSSDDYSRIYSSILSAGATIGSALTTIATGGFTAPMTLGLGANLLGNGINMTPDVNYSSGNGSINGLLASQTAYLIVETPKEKVADKQDSYFGRTSLITMNLGDCSGYTKCLRVHLDNILCLETERASIEADLLNGVRIETGSETPTYTGNKQALIFLKCVSDRDVIGKTWLNRDGENDIMTVEGKLLYDKDILSPTFLVSSDVIEYNYCYIPMFKRFYYITAIVARTGNQKELTLACDELQSWKEGILANEAVLERQENEYNTYVSDSETWTQQNKTVDIIPFRDDVGKQIEFKREDNKYIITIAGSDT